jgi:hypothetical protein
MISAGAAMSEMLNPIARKSTHAVRETIGLQGEGVREGFNRSRVSRFAVSRQQFEKFISLQQ